LQDLSEQSTAPEWTKISGRFGGTEIMEEAATSFETSVIFTMLKLYYIQINFI